MITRRSLLTGFTALLAAPAIVRVGSLMPVKVWEPIENSFWANLPGTDLNEQTLEDAIVQIQSIGWSDTASRAYFAEQRRRGLEMLGVTR